MVNMILGVCGFGHKIGACICATLNCHLGRVTPLYAPSGSVADGVSWTAVRPVPHVDLLPERFVRVILAQGPCQSSLYRSNFKG